MDKKSLVGGIMLGAMLSLVVGFGACFLMLGNYGSSPKNYEKTYAKAITNIHEQASKRSPDAESVWLYANLVAHRDMSDYDTLGLNHSTEEANAEFMRLLDKAVKLGSRDAMVQKGLLDIYDGLATNADINLTKARYKLLDVQKVTAGFDLLNAALAGGCNLYDGYDNTGNDFVSLGFVDADSSIGSKTFALKDLVYNSELTNHPTLEQTVVGFFVLEDIGCNEKDRLVRLLIEDVLEGHNLSFKTKVYDHVLAKLLAEDDIAYLISKKVEPEHSERFLSLSKLWLDYFKNTHTHTLNMLNATSQQPLTE